jgi:hypothetical protein
MVGYLYTFRLSFSGPCRERGPAYEPVTGHVTSPITGISLITWLATRMPHHVPRLRASGLADWTLASSRSLLLRAHVMQRTTDIGPLTAPAPDHSP